MVKKQSVSPERRVVYLSGCWDLFHVGHLWALQHARAMGDFLVVGCNTDEFVQSYKPDGPVIPYEYRCIILRTLPYVDAVVPHSSFSDTTGFGEYGVNIRAIGPDFGGFEEQRRCIEEHLANGIAVIQFPWRPGGKISTTIIKEKVKCLSGQK